MGIGRWGPRIFPEHSMYTQRGRDCKDPRAQILVSATAAEGAGGRERRGFCHPSVDPLSYRSDPFGSLRRSDISFTAKHSPERLTQ